MPKITQCRIKDINKHVIVNMLFQKVIYGNIVNKVINGNIVNMMLKIIEHPIYKTLNLVGHVWVTYRSKIAKILLMGNPTCPP